MSDQDDSSSPATRSRNWLIAGGVLTLILILGILVTVSSLLGDDTPPEPTPGADPSGSSPPTPTDPNASVCGLEAQQMQGNLNAAPKDVTWSLVGRVAVPASDAHGPGVVEENGLRYCYAHTPEGALMMASNIYAWTFIDDAEGVASQSIASGPGRAAALANAREAQDAPPAELIQIRGFRVLAYDGDTAMIDIALQSETGGYAHQALELHWEEGDWKLRVSPDGSMAPASPLPGLTGYVPFSGA